MNAVIGTAGHVDHGKSSLIKALTGINPTRLPQELLREMTIDLGFAHFKTATGDKIGIIDVPGHERFIRNMVSAVWGLDMVLFIVAADEGWATLSAEHLRIISAMGIRECILVITKSDLVDQKRLRDVENEALEHFLLEMNTLPDVIHVSAHNGQGIEELKQLIINKVEAIELREDLDKQPHLYVDRVFSINGVGTTVTGTLRGGEIKEGDTLTLLPGKQSVKVRSLQGYHTQLKTAPPYARTAISLKQVNKKLISRGSCLVANPHSITLSTDWIVQLDSSFSSSLKKQGIIEVALGTAHVRAKCYVYAEGKLARLQLDSAIPAFWGQPLLLIQHGGSHIIGAGRLAWMQPLDRKMRQKLQETLSTLKIDTANKKTSQITLQLAMVGYTQQIKDIPAPEHTINLGSWWVCEQAMINIRNTCDSSLNKAIHAMTIEELARETELPISLIDEVVNQACTSGDWQKMDGGIISTLVRKDSPLPANQQQLLEEINSVGSKGYDASKSSIVGIRRLLRALTERQLIVPTENDLFFSQTVYKQIVQQIMENRKIKDILNVAEARDCTGLSRKQLIPLFNRLEQDGWVKRVGNDREVCRVYSSTDNPHQNNKT